MRKSKPLSGEPVQSTDIEARATAILRRIDLDIEQQPNCLAPVTDDLKIRLSRLVGSRAVDLEAVIEGEVNLL